MNSIDLDKEFLQSLGDRIRIAREYRKFSQDELAQQLSPSCRVQDIAKMEIGFSSISVADLNRIAIILNTPLYHFIDDGALFWFDDRRFAAAYSILPEDARSKVREVVFALAGDTPILHS